MLDIIGELNSEYRTFNLDKINIEDEGMEDLEKFNYAYKIDSSKCSLYEKPQKIPQYTQINDETRIDSKAHTCFRIDLYIRRILEKMKVKQIKSVILELGTISSNDFTILMKIKSIRSNWNKNKLINLAIDIIMKIINKDE